MRLWLIAMGFAAGVLAINACGDDTGKLPPDGGTEGMILPDFTFPEGSVKDLPPQPDGIKADKGGSCQFNDNQSCDGGQACPTGQQPVNEADKKCHCRVPCNPDGASPCGAGCGRVCVQLLDSKQQPIPGVGACIPDQGAKAGEQCAPTACQQGLSCIGPSNDQAFCRPPCKLATDCKGLKMVCGQLTGKPGKVCVPGGSTTGPDEGGDCSKAADFCKSGLVCDPASKKCLKLCNTDGTPPPSICTKGQVCANVEDTAAGVLLGKGCKTGSAPADGGAAADAGP